MFDENEILKLLKGQKIVVSISGSDNTGKSTQLRLLREKYPKLFSKPYHILQSDFYPKIIEGREKGFSKWWFEPKNAENMAYIMIRSIADRHNVSAEDTAPIILYDRDDQSYINKTISAMLVTGHTQSDAVDIVNRLSRHCGLDKMKGEDVKIYISGLDDVEKTIKPEENKNSNNPELYKQHMIMTKFLDQKTLTTDDTYSIISYRQDDIIAMQNDILDVIYTKVLEKDDNRIDNNNLSL